MIYKPIQYQKYAVGKIASAVTGLLLNLL